jgi:hypothetical protein
MIRNKYLCMLQMQSSNIISEAPSQITNEVRNSHSRINWSISMERRWFLNGVIQILQAGV